MNEKILALLIAKFAQARKDGLQQLARSLALQVADETEAQALVDKLQDSQVTNFIKDWRKEVDSEVSKSTKTFEDNMKSKFDLVEKKNPTPNPKTDDPTDMASIIAKAVSDAVKPLQEKLVAIESGTVVKNRKQTLESKLESAPESFKKTVLKHFEKMNFESDEDFETFLSETEADASTMEQEVANKGLGLFPKPNVTTPKKVVEGAQLDIKDWAESSKKENNN